MANTGVKIDDEVTTKYNDFKMGQSKYRYIFFKVADDKKSIVVDKLGDYSKTYADFVAELPKEDCRYAVVNYEYSQGSDGNRSKIVFVNWAPETAPTKSKMIYAGTKADVKKCLVGLSIEVQGTDLSEVDEKTILDKLKTVSK